MVKAIEVISTKEIGKIAETTEVPKSGKLKEVVLKPDVDLIKSTSLESLKGTELDIPGTIAKPEIPNSNPMKEVKDDCFSTYEERFNQTPVNGGEWQGQRGESTFLSVDKEANKYLKDAHIDGIKYTNCIPDFSEVSKGNVKIPEMSEARTKNFKQADEQLADKKGCTPREVAEWREKNGYTWHECNDMKTCQKVPRSVNASFGHLGGVSEVKKLKMESEFDA